MSNIKTDHMRERERINHINDVIQGHAMLKGIRDPRAISKKTGINYSTLRTRIHDPEMYRLDELMAIGKISGFEVRLYASDSGGDRRIW